MSLSLESNQVVGVPAPEGFERPDPHERFWFRYLSDDRVEVHHPFHGTTTLGDRSRFPDPAVDDALVLGFHTFAYTADTMKLSRNRRFETQPGAGEYAQLSHGTSLACLGRLAGGGPQDIISAFFSDTPHAYGGHGVEDNYQGHGQENLHDLRSADFFLRSGFIKQLIDREILTGENLFLRGTRLACHNFLSEEVSKVRRSFLSNNHPARRLDSDRFQYNEEEDYYTKRKPVWQTDKSLQFVARMTVTEDDEGEQLVFTDAKTARDAAFSYTRKNSEHWLEPVQDALSDTMNFMERYLFVCNHPLARQHQEFYPHDYLYVGASQMFELFDEVAKDDPVMAYLLELCEDIAKHQRGIMPLYELEYNPYLGPKPPDGMTIQMVSSDAQKASISFNDRHLRLVLPPGKVRKLDPRILRSNGQTIPVSQLYRDYEVFLAQQEMFIGTYLAKIEVPAGLAKELGRAVELVNTAWAEALKRPPMPASEFQERIRLANEHVLRVGAFTLKNGQASH